MSVSAQSLINEYLALKQQKNDLDSRFSQLENRIASYCRQHQTKTLRTSKHLLFLVQKLRTVFPQKDNPLRLKLESVLQSFPERQQFLTLDVIKLGQAYDHRRLPQKLINLLKPLATKEPYLRITLKPLKPT